MNLQFPNKFLAINDRHSRSIRLFLTLWLAGTFMLQFLVLGIAKGTLSHSRLYNVVIGLLAGLATLADLNIILIQYVWGAREI